MLSEEEKKLLKIFKAQVEKEEQEYFSVNAYTQLLYDSHRTVLNLITKLEKENEEKDNKVRKIISRLDNDYKRITETKTNKNTFPNYLDDYSRCRLKAYRTKTREIKEYIEQEYFQKLAKKERRISNESND